MTQLDIIKAPVANYVEDFHRQFEEMLHSKSQWLQTAVEHLSKATGKMVRPIMTSLMAGLYGLPLPEATINSAVLLELIHTATLIHDDVIDNALKRRGRPTLNAIFDNRIAVLMGDFVLSSALVSAIALEDLRIIGIISGIGRELTEGEIRQFESAENGLISEENYMDVIKQKTAILFQSCAEIAGITVKAKEEDIQALAKCGELIGLAFQIRDDIFDYFSEDVGKPTGHDIEEGKVTLPLLHALLEDKEQSEEGKACMQIIKSKDFNQANIQRLINFALERGGIDYAEKQIQSLLDEAKDIVKQFPSSACQMALFELIDFIGTRTK